MLEQIYQFFLFLRDFAEFILSIFTLIRSFPIIIEYLVQSFSINEGFAIIGGFLDGLLEILMWILGIFALA